MSTSGLSGCAPRQSGGGEFMKSSLLVGLSVAPLLTSPIVAADLPTKAKVPPPALYNWTGCYGGGHFGSLFEQQDWGALGSDSGPGLVVGGQLGCNYQISTWVFGIQGD